MKVEGLNEVVEYATDKLENRLRVVALLSEHGREVAFIRDDVAALYDEGDFEQIQQELVLSTVEQGHQEGLYEVGGAHATIRVFNEAVSMVFDDPENNEVILVSFDRDTELPLLGFVAECRERIEQYGTD